MATRRSDMVVSDSAMFALWQETRSDMNRQFDEVKQLLSDHVRDDLNKFEKIGSRLDGQDKQNAEEHGATKAKAKVWAVLGGSASVLVTLAVAVFKYYHRLP